MLFIYLRRNTIENLPLVAASHLACHIVLYNCMRVLSISFLLLHFFFFFFFFYIHENHSPKTGSADKHISVLAEEH